MDENPCVHCTQDRPQTTLASAGRRPGMTLEIVRSASTRARGTRASSLHRRESLARRREPLRDGRRRRRRRRRRRPVPRARRGHRRRFAYPPRAGARGGLARATTRADVASVIVARVATRMRPSTRHARRREASQLGRSGWFRVHFIHDDAFDDASGLPGARYHGQRHGARARARWLRRRGVEPKRG